MTAAQLIINLQKTSLIGLKIGDTAVGDNTTLLLEILNMAKDKIAEDTRIWLNGETVSQVTGTAEYTLTRTPLQIIDVFDANNILRQRNSQDTYGYFQTAPNKIKFNLVTNGLDVYVNYYDIPDDYITTDILALPGTLLSAMQYYMAHKAYSQYKGELELAASREYYAKYKDAINDYRATTDTTDVDSVVNLDNKVWLRGIR